MRKSSKLTKVLCGALGLIMVTGAASCGGGVDPDEVKFYIYGTTEQLNMYNAMVNEFNKTYGKEHSIRAKTYPQLPGSYESIIKTKSNSRTGPDVYLMADASFKGWIVNNYYGPIQEYLETYDYETRLGDIMETTIDRLRYDVETNTSNDDDPLYGLPLDTQPTALYYNKTLLESAGIHVISVDEEDLDEFNAGTKPDRTGKYKNEFVNDFGSLADVTIPAKGYYRSESPYFFAGEDTEPWTPIEPGEVLVFNNRIAMNWDEVEDLGCLFSASQNPSKTNPEVTEYGTTYGYFTEWWFNYGWSVGGDCLQDLSGEGDWNFSLLDPNPNYLVLPGKTYTGHYTGEVYKEGETLDFKDKMDTAAGEILVPDSDYGNYYHGSVAEENLATINDAVLQAVKDGVLAQMPSMREAFQRYLLLGTKKTANIEGVAGMDIYPNPNTFTGTVTAMSYFWSGNIALVANTALFMPDVAKNMDDRGLQWDIAPLAIYKEYADPEDPDCDEVIAQGKRAGHSNTLTMVVRKKSTKHDKAVQFMIWMASAEGQYIRAKLGFFPNQRSLIDDIEFNAEYAPDNVVAFSDVLEYQTPGDWWYMPDHIWVEEWCVDLNSYLRNAIQRNKGEGVYTWNMWVPEAIQRTNTKLLDYKQFQRD